MNDFKLNSGERQTGTRIVDIREDHRARYRMVVDHLNQWYRRAFRETSELYGADIFCGNGYGTFLLSDEVNCVVHGMDASDEAIKLANGHYSTIATVFSVKKYPFIIPKNVYDFVVSMESVEHVVDSSGLISGLVSALKPGGFLFLSTPNADVLSLELNPNKFHYRHFTFDETVGEVRRKTPDMELIKWYGQDVYTMEGGRVIGRVQEEHMYLQAEYKNGQFLCFVFRKPELPNTV